VDLTLGLRVVQRRIRREHGISSHVVSWRERDIHGWYRPQLSDRFALRGVDGDVHRRDPFASRCVRAISGLDVITELGKRNVFGFELLAGTWSPCGPAPPVRRQAGAEARKRMAVGAIACVNWGQRVRHRCSKRITDHHDTKCGCSRCSATCTRSTSAWSWAAACVDLGGGGTAWRWTRLRTGRCHLGVREGLDYMLSYIDMQGYRGYGWPSTQAQRPRATPFLPGGHALG